MKKAGAGVSTSPLGFTVVGTARPAQTHPFITGFILPQRSLYYYKLIKRHQKSNLLPVIELYRWRITHTLFIVAFTRIKSTFFLRPKGCSEIGSQYGLLTNVKKYLNLSGICPRKENSATVIQFFFFFGSGQ
jgi:hypothetical protein